MMMQKRNLDQSRHPFNKHPFEALSSGSWHAVDCIKIRDGNMTLHFVDETNDIETNGPCSNLRIKSRHATLTDCTCFLRAGVDVSVFSPHLNDEKSHEESNSNEESNVPIRTDARISSIERNPHEPQCCCRFYVNFYVTQGPLGSGKGALSKETTLVGLDQISILQKLDKEPHEGQYYRWHYSEDCSSLQKTKLFLGKFIADLSWLLATSVLTHSNFDVRSVSNKIVYQIMDDENDSSSVKDESCLDAVNFSSEDGVLVGMGVRSVETAAPDAGSHCDLDEAGTSPCYDIMNLRRSKRRNVQPERYMGCDNLLDLDVGFIQTRYRVGKSKEEMENETYLLEDGKVDMEDELSLTLACLFPSKRKSAEVDTESKSVVSGNKSPKEIIVYKRRRKKKMLVRSGLYNQIQDQKQLAIVPFNDETSPLRLDLECFHENARKSRPVEAGETSVKSCSRSSAFRVRKKVAKELEQVDVRDLWCESAFDDKIKNTAFVNPWEEKSCSKKFQRKLHHQSCSKQQNHCEDVKQRRKVSHFDDYNKLINTYMKNLEQAYSKEEPPIIDQWNEFKANGFKAARSSKRHVKMEGSSDEDDGETSELEMLWKEMEISLAQAYLDEQNEGSDSGDSTSSAKDANEHCWHDFRLDEEIGIKCRFCGFVSTEIKDVFAPFKPNIGTTTEHKPSNEDVEKKADQDENPSFTFNQGPSNTPSSEANDNVWALIPEARKKLHLHQKKAFEFLWRNMAGSLNPAEMDPSSESIGGCVISHSPGAGKTFLIIAFLSSYLKLFPGKRPLILAPKTTLYTWYKEFKKWEIPVPVHLIHGRKTYRGFKQRIINLPGGRKPKQDVMHVLDCLEKMQKWHAQPSVLVMGYTSFLTLMRDDSKFEHRKYMAKVLRESPGMLILDEGHNPRSTKSRLRKVLMKVETDLRILLSGTLFQNNFCEYFNTLSLARPKFIFEVLKELNPKLKKKRKVVDKARYLMEARARKIFLDNIAEKIDSNKGEERMQGLNVLRNITKGFIDVYEGGSSDGLPGLQIYTILMNSSELQHGILVKLQNYMGKCNGYPLEIELLITLGSIHPWLIKSSTCVNKFFSPDELMDLDKLKFDYKKGFKVMFVLRLVYSVVRNEKVLIFCHNIAPIRLFAELFERVFNWRTGREILILTGDLELFERGKVMDTFEEPNGPSRILLASITACAEGISLTAASRVIMLDSEWNPSKTKQAIARAFRPGQDKMVYVYQLLATGTLEEDKYRRTTWKEWVSRMIFSEEFVADPSSWQAPKIEDDILREMVEDDKHKLFHMIMKNEKASTDHSSKKTEVISALITDESC